MTFKKIPFEASADEKTTFEPQQQGQVQQTDMQKLAAAKGITPTWIDRRVEEQCTGGPSTPQQG
jgi:hypothetical protein